jgi:threonine dehydratase
VSQNAGTAEIESARTRLRGIVARTPVVPCASTGNKRIHLKLENLQPAGSFKLRPIGNAILSKPPDALSAGVHTYSSGNSAVAMAWMAMRVGITATAVVPEGAPESKLALLRALDARIVAQPLSQWWGAVTSGGRNSQLDSVYIDAVRDPAAWAGNGTIALEILEDLPEVDAIFVPFGGGGLACGIANAVRALRPAVKVIVCELETAHPFKSARAAGGPVDAPCDPGFVTGVGFGSVLAEMWPVASRLIDDTLTVSLSEVVAAIRLMADKNKVIAEGAGAIPVAAALAGRHAFSNVCAVVSGGNLDSALLVKILRGEDI